MRIRKSIIAGAYLHCPDGRCGTAALAGEIGFSPSPIREALRQLEIDGLVRTAPRLGARVVAMDLSEFRELCEVRLGLESCAAELAAEKHEPADLLEVRNAFDAMERLVSAMKVKSGSLQALHVELRQEGHSAFISAIVAAAHNHWMKNEIHRLQTIEWVVSGTVYKDRIRIHSEPAGARYGDAGCWRTIARS